jgi:hypothetical protein
MRHSLTSQHGRAHDAVEILDPGMSRDEMLAPERSVR